VEVGSHDQLMAQGPDGVYRAMWELQDAEQVARAASASPPPPVGAAVIGGDDDFTAPFGDENLQAGGGGLNINGAAQAGVGGGLGARGGPLNGGAALATASLDGEAHEEAEAAKAALLRAASG
jgi:hypothetical protein